jgi:hypothetical protein
MNAILLILLIFYYASDSYLIGPLRVYYRPMTVGSMEADLPPTYKYMNMNREGGKSASKNSFFEWSNIYIFEIGVIR